MDTIRAHQPSGIDLNPDSGDDPDATDVEFCAEDVPSHLVPEFELVDLTGAMSRARAQQGSVEGGVTWCASVETLWSWAT